VKKKFNKKNTDGSAFGTIGSISQAYIYLPKTLTCYSKALLVWGWK